MLQQYELSNKPLMTLQQRDISDMKYRIGNTMRYWMENGKSLQEFYQDNKKYYEQVSEFVDITAQKKKKLRIMK